jgi:hypothetical protein
MLAGSCSADGLSYRALGPSSGWPDRIEDVYTDTYDMQNMATQ